MMLWKDTKRKHNNRSMYICLVILIAYCCCVVKFCGTGCLQFSLDLFPHFVCIKDKIKDSYRYLFSLNDCANDPRVAYIGMRSCK